MINNISIGKRQIYNETKIPIKIEVKNCFHYILFPLLVVNLCTSERLFIKSLSEKVSHDFQKIVNR